MLPITPLSKKDPRLFQIASLSLLLAYGMTVLSFDVSLIRAWVLVSIALLAPTRMHPRLPTAPFRPVERPHFRPLPLPSPAHQFSGDRGRRGRPGDLEQIPSPLEWQAPLQPDQHRADGRPRDVEPRLGLARSVGQRRVLRVLHRLRRTLRRAARRPRRRHARVPRDVSPSRIRPVGSASRAAHDSAASAGERRAAALRLLHDLRSKDDARFADGAHPLRRPGRARGRLRPVPAVSP